MRSIAHKMFFYWVGTKVRFLALKFLYFKNFYILQN